MTSPRILSRKCLCKPLLRSTFSFKLESYSPQYCKKNRRKLDFLCVLRTSNSENRVLIPRFPRSYSYKKVLSTTGTKSEIFQTKKDFIINLFKVNNEWTQTCKTKPDNIEETSSIVITAAVYFAHAEFNVTIFKL